MIKIDHCVVKEASRVYGDFAEKLAFNVNIDPAAVLGSIAGGYTASHVYNKKRDDHLQQENDQRRIENNTYSQVENVFRDLKIVFTPINVIYNVNGQVFEIIKVGEMTPHMRAAFLQKDADYFRSLLMNKINMEIQLAEQAFAQRLLASGGFGGQTKQASYTSKQLGLVKVSEKEFDHMHKVASTGMEDAKLAFDVSFENLRPFSRSEIFFDTKEFSKVAGIFGLFNSNDGAGVDALDVRKLNNEVNVGFLPDRVVYLWNGHLVEQMSLLNMNQEGFEAFRRKDKPFFIDLFRRHTKEQDQEIQKSANELTEEIEHEDTLIDKEAASLEEIVGHVIDEEVPVIEREKVDVFVEPDIHPIIYDKILSSKYGEDWTTHEFESILKQIEIDFNLSEGIGENAINKLAIFHTISMPDHAMYQSTLTFEKFVRGVNSKDVLFEEIQGGLSFEEILFALEVAKNYSGEEVFFEFNDQIPLFVAEELLNENVRFVSKQLFNETNESEKMFFDQVNDHLMRLWKDVDARAITDQKVIEQRHILSEQIVEIADEVLHQYAEFINIDNPYGSVEQIITDNNLLKDIHEENKEAVKNVSKSNVVDHYIAALFIEYKHKEFDYLITKIQGEGVNSE